MRLRRMNPRRLACWLTVIGLGPLWGAVSQEPAREGKAANRWEGAIQRFEQQDRESSSPKNAILFVGSSSIRMWDLPKCFPDLNVVNRGFGGSQIADSLEFAPRIVLPYRPRIIVFYAGDNDINAGKTPEQVLRDFKAFVKIVRATLPETRIRFIAIKPSVQRWHLVDKMREANALILRFIEADDRLAYVDIDKPMIGEDGKPRAALFLADGLHLNEAGYRLWTSLVRPYLEPAAKRKVGEVHYGITPLNTGICAMGKQHVLGDEYSDEDRVPFALYSFLIEGPQGEIAIVDFGPKDPTYFNEMFRRYKLFRERGDGRENPDDVVQSEGNTLDHLRRRGIAPDKVGQIIFTHLHYDHLGGSRPPDPGLLGDFPNAVVYISKKGWQHNLDSRKEGGQWASYVDFDISQHIFVRGREGAARFEDDAQILPGILTAYLGGHSPCSQAVLVETADGTAIIAGDVAYHYEFLEKGVVARLRTTDAEWIASTDRMVELAERTSGTLLPVHDPLIGEAHKTHGERWLATLRPLSDRAVAGWKARRGNLKILGKHRNP